MTLAVDDARPPDPGSASPRPLSTLYFLLIVAGLTLAAGGVGFLSGLQIVSTREDTARSKAAEQTNVAASGLQHLKSANLKPLAPIVTNLAGTPPVWIRIEASLMFNDAAGNTDVLAARIAEDIVGYLRTVEMSQIEGATGFQHLSEDLNERARARSDGRVHELIIQGLIIE